MARKSMDFITKFPPATREWLDGRRIEEVECIIADFVGMSRGKAMPAATFNRSESMFFTTNPSCIKPSPVITSIWKSKISG